ncbi:MAG: four helix bundle protein [Saprospiraceae bacterium]|nr:four helix bundle protein [Saprospiraceae bacterium]
MSYKKLEIWRLAREMAIDVHRMSLRLPKFELYEIGSQIRRSSKSVKSNIVEGYGRRRYPADRLRFVTYALSSNDETMDHLETLYETGSLNDETVFLDLRKKIVRLGVKLNNFQATLIREL